MKSSKFWLGTFFRVAFVFATMFLLGYFILNKNYIYLLLLIPIILFQFYSYYKFQKMVQKELDQFVESIHYRDFSRHFDLKHSSVEMQPIRKGFNQINDTFKIISKEKETHYLYLSTILDFIDTGILSYDFETGEVLWMNEGLKKMLQIPYLKSIKSLEKRNEELFNQINELIPGNNTVTVINNKNNNIKVLLSATSFQTDGHRYKLIAFQNINEAIEETESNAWKKLLSVMTHEIMNSVAPISSLAETLKVRLHETVEKPSNETIEDLETGINTIQKRSEGLLKFTESYRSLSKINKIDAHKTKIIDLIDHVLQLLQPSLDKRKIEVDVIILDPSITVNVDAPLVEQVLINLIINAIDAVKEVAVPKISINVTAENNGRVSVRIIDNGTGIEKEILDKIFIPFFSTKKLGSGIGLNLCKQIMMLHKGTINVESTPGNGSVFTLAFLS